MIAETLHCWGVFDFATKEVHFMPCDEKGQTDHICRKDCYCNPYFVKKDGFSGRELWQHNEAS